MFEEMAKNRQHRHYHRVSPMARQTIQKNTEMSKNVILQARNHSALPIPRGRLYRRFTERFLLFLQHREVQLEYIQKVFVFTFNSSNGGSVPPELKETDRQKAMACTILKTSHRFKKNQQ